MATMGGRIVAEHLQVEAENSAMDDDMFQSARQVLDDNCCALQRRQSALCGALRVSEKQSVRHDSIIRTVQLCDLLARAAFQHLYCATLTPQMESLSAHRWRRNVFRHLVERDEPKVSRFVQQYLPEMLLLLMLHLTVVRSQRSDRLAFMCWPACQLAESGGPTRSLHDCKGNRTSLQRRWKDLLQNNAAFVAQLDMLATRWAQREMMCDVRRSVLTATNIAAKQLRVALVKMIELV